MTTRISGVLVAWRLSKGGGMGRVLADGNNYFICKRFIIEGLPIVGSPLTFEVAPPLPGKLFPQAINVKINNRKIVHGHAEDGKRQKRCSRLFPRGQDSKRG